VLMVWLTFHIHSHLFILFKSFKILTIQRKEKKKIFYIRDMTNNSLTCSVMDMIRYILTFLSSSSSPLYSRFFYSHYSAFSSPRKWAEISINVKVEFSSSSIFKQFSYLNSTLQKIDFHAIMSRDIPHRHLTFVVLIKRSKLMFICLFFLLILFSHATLISV